MCPAGAVVAEVAGLNPFTAVINSLSLNALKSVTTFKGNSNVSVLSSRIFVLIYTFYT